MSTEYPTSTPGSKSRRKLVIAAVLAAVALVTTGAVAYWSGDTWSDAATASGFPGLPGGDWASTPTDDGWGSPEPSTPEVTSETGTPSASGRPTSSATAATAATAVVDPASAPTTVPTVTAPAPSSSSATATATSTGAPSPTPTSTTSGPKPKPTKKPRPTPTPSPTSSTGGCVLLIICH